MSRMRPRLALTSRPTRRQAFAAAAALAGRHSPAPAQDSFRLAQVPGESLAVLWGGRQLFHYQFSPARPKTYVHPLFLPNGVPLTLDGAGDHVHHRGLMLAWSDVNGFDFWGERNPGQKGRMAHRKFERVSPGPPAEVVALIDWAGGGKTILEERRTLRAPVPTADGVIVEWQSELRAPSDDVVLDASRAVYAGLGIRFVYSMSGEAVSVLNSNGTAEVKKAFGEPARWCAMHGPCAVGTRGGTAILDHPSNPRHPTPFAVYNPAHMGYFSAAPTFKEHKLVVPAGKAIRFRYLVLAFPGKPDPAGIDRLFKTWSET